MSNFSINFLYPWLLLLFIPAIVFTLWPYFRLSKKYRRTRNRIISIVLHLIIMVLSVSVLAGVTFGYDEPNLSNEVILLVDVSHSNNTSEDQKDQFIKTVLDESGETFQVGIVTFGYGQVYAAELSNDTDAVFRQYQNAARPNDAGTDIASALNYAKGLFKNPGTGKIVLMTDGIETDGAAMSVIMSIASEGIRVDTVFFENNFYESEVQLIEITVPDYSIVVGDPCEIGITVQSTAEGAANIILVDNDIDSAPMPVTLTAGIQPINFTHTFLTPGLHKISFKIESDDDTLTENNTFHSYIYLEVFDRILIVDRGDESERLNALLEDEYNVDIINIADVPVDLDALREYDQVILMNIANSDMPEGFDLVLNSYVHDLGGGLFTVGGSKIEDGKEVANAYNRSDMVGTLFQQMLPVQAVDYTPPIALMLVIDRSGSMDSKDNQTGKSKLDLAKEGAAACINALSERDYCGVITLESDYNEELTLTPVPQKAKILSAISNITVGGGTVYTGAIQRAGQALNAVKNVERKHIIFVTDGEPGDSPDQYEPWITHYNQTAGVTMSVVAIGISGEAKMKRMAELGNGRYYGVWDVTTLPRLMREDLNVPEIKDVNMEPFKPTIKHRTAAVNGIIEADIPELEGFYGTRAKASAEVPLMAPYVPVYAQWKYGAGKVGSFMSDLNGHWSDNFLSDATGIRFINNVVKGLFPTESIRKRDIDAEFKPDNYSTQVSIFTSLAPGDTVELMITSPPASGGSDPTVQIIKPDPADGFSKCVFTVSQPGIHEVRIQKKNAGGTLVSEYVAYSAFSYSAEYNVFRDRAECELFLADLAKGGRGAVVDAGNPAGVFEEFTRSIPKTYDPRVPLIIIALVLFLLDIAVRKFKFKWPHEIVRDYKAKKLLKQGKN